MKLVMTDHCKRENWVTDWRRGKIITSESSRFSCWMREAAEIRHTQQEQAEWANQLSHIWDPGLKKLPGDENR